MILICFNYNFWSSFKHDVVKHKMLDGVLVPYIVEADNRQYFFKPFWRLEIGFTLFYNLEVLFKVICYGKIEFIGTRFLNKKQIIEVLTTSYIFVVDILSRMERLHFSANAKVWTLVGHHDNHPHHTGSLSFSVVDIPGNIWKIFRVSSWDAHDKSDKTKCKRIYFFIL